MDRSTNPTRVIINPCFESPPLALAAMADTSRVERTVLATGQTAKTSGPAETERDDPDLRPRLSFKSKGLARVVNGFEQVIQEDTAHGATGSGCACPGASLETTGGNAW